MLVIPGGRVRAFPLDVVGLVDKILSIHLDGQLGLDVEKVILQILTAAQPIDLLVKGEDIPLG